MRRPIYLKESDMNEPPAFRTGIFPVVRTPLIKGGQGRTDKDATASGIEFALFAIVGFLLLGVFFLAAVLIKYVC